jgi:hypothetical protein
MIKKGLPQEVQPISLPVPDILSINSTPAAASSLCECSRMGAIRELKRLGSLRKTLPILTASALPAFEDARLVRHYCEANPRADRCSGPPFTIPDFLAAGARGLVRIYD